MAIIICKLLNNYLDYLAYCFQISNFKYSKLDSMQFL